MSDEADLRLDDVLAAVELMQTSPGTTFLPRVQASAAWP